MINNPPTVSIIIPTLNSDRTIGKCLESIKNQSYKNIEIIIIDAGSKDKTIDVAKEYGVDIYTLNNSGMSEATNYGVKKSKGLYIYRVDSDVIIDKTLVSEAIVKCEIEEYDGVCIFWLPDDSLGFWSKIRKTLFESYIHDPTYVGSIKYNKNLLGARFLKKEVFMEVGGYNEKVPLAGEDYEFYNRLADTNFKFGLISSKEKHIGEPTSLLDIYKKNIRYGFSLNELSIEGKHGIKQLSVFGRKYYFNAFKNAAKNGPIHFFGLILYILIVHISGLHGFLYYKLTN